MATLVKLFRWLLDLVATHVYKMDASTCSPNITVFADEPHRVRREMSKQSTDGVRGLLGLDEGKHLVEFRFNERPWGSHCSIGVCTRKAELLYPGKSM